MNNYVKCNHCGNIQSEEELLIVDDKEACIKCQKTDALMDVEIEKKAAEPLFKKYYRLLCLQGTGYMATGYNATSLAELFDDYASYKSNDWDSDDEGTMEENWKKMSEEEKIDFINGDEFLIESGDEPFDEKDIH